MSRCLFYPHARKVIQRLPEFYRKRYLEGQNSCSKISYIDDDSTDSLKVINNTLYPKEYFDVPPKVIFPEESQRALWGGEGIVSGFIEVKRTHTRVPKTWGPQLEQHLFYSEILDRWLVIIVSLTALKQIEALKGLDFYILKTPDNEINSRLGIYLKREMLLSLSDPAFKQRNPSVARKYAQFEIPREEAEWIGLSLDEAITKQMDIEYAQERSEASVPKKLIFARKLIEKMNSDESLPENSKTTETMSAKLSRFLYGEKRSKS